MFNSEAKIATLEEDWEGKWFSIVARLFPNKLTFQGVGFNRWEIDESQSVQVGLALPRDGGLTPVIPRQLGGPDETAPWPSNSPHVSFAGPVDLDIFHIKDGVWPEPLTKTSVFVRLGSYLQPENDRPPRKGPKVVDSTVRILVILPDSWEFIRQNTLSAYNTSTPTSWNPVNGSPTTPRSAGPGGITTRKPFSSPDRRRNLTLLEGTSPSTLTRKHTDCQATYFPTSRGTTPNSITVDVDLELTAPTPNSDRLDDASDTEQLLDAQLASSGSTLTRKRREPSSPGPVRSKRTTAGRKKARLYN